MTELRQEQRRGVVHVYNSSIYLPREYRCHAVYRPLDANASFTLGDLHDTINSPQVMNPTIWI